MKTFEKVKRNDKGFTLVEIIVVLVILAVLAAFTIPTMLGFVEEAKGKAYIAEAREVYVAAQATATEYVGNGTTFTVAKPLAIQLGSEQIISGWPEKFPASETMRNYLSKDIKISPGKTPPKLWHKTQGFAGWEVSLDGGKVTKVEYYKYDYKVTIEVGGSTSVEKIL